MYLHKIYKAAFSYYVSENVYAHMYDHKWEDKRKVLFSDLHTSELSNQSSPRNISSISKHKKGRKWCMKITPI